MPQNQDCNQRDFSRYDALSTEELSEILRLDSETPEGNGLDIDTLLYITGVLAERKKNTNTGKTAQEAWKSFQQNYLDSEETCSAVTEEKKPVKTKNPWVRRVAAAAAVLVLLICIPLSARALNWEEICNTVVKWAKETFSFVMGDIDGPEAKNTRQYDSLQDALEQMDVPSNWVPAWVPEGYVFERVDVDETPLHRSYIALYRCGEKPMSIGIYSYQETDPQRVEINDNLIDTYKTKDNEYYIISNNDRVKAVWILDSYECFVSGDLTVDEIKQMINSIPEG